MCEREKAARVRAAGSQAAQLAAPGTYLGGIVIVNGAIEV